MHRVDEAGAVVGDGQLDCGGGAGLTFAQRVQVGEELDLDRPAGQGHAGGRSGGVHDRPGTGDRFEAASGCCWAGQGGDGQRGDSHGGQGGEDAPVGGGGGVHRSSGGFDTGSVPAFPPPRHGPADP